MANQNSTFSGQIVGQDITSNETRLIKTDADGNLNINVLSLPPTPAGANVMGTVKTQRSSTDVTLVDGTLTATTASTAITGLGLYAEGQVFLNVTAKSGTSPTLNCAIQTSTDGTNYFTIADFNEATVVSTQHIVLTNFGNKLRINSVLGGTSPSFTFKITASLKS